MAEIRFTNAAEADLIDIDGFSTIRFGEHTGDAYMRGFEAAFARLSEFPEAGPVIPDLGSHIRCLVQRSHRIFYRMDGDSVLILRVLHHARDAGRHVKS